MQIQKNSFDRLRPTIENAPKAKGFLGETLSAMLDSSRYFWSADSQPKRGMRRPLYFIVIMAVMVSAGCDTADPTVGSGRDCSSDGIGCSDGFTCQLQDNDTYRCLPVGGPTAGTVVDPGEQRADLAGESADAMGGQASDGGASGEMPLSDVAGSDETASTGGTSLGGGAVTSETMGGTADSVGGTAESVGGTAESVGGTAEPVGGTGAGGSDKPVTAGESGSGGLAEPTPLGGRPTDGGSGPVGGALTTVDTDGDGVFDTQDNCPNTANPAQLDGDGDTVGNVCDAQPEQPNLRLTGQFLTLGGLLVDNTFTQRAKAHTSAAETSDGTLILKGRIQP